ncbi:tail tube protein [Xanthomonas phage Pagan]|uniref:Tail tube protein n=1 Tax=Xanthomonas phage Pagan TaxID=2591104 RepID=A0A5B9N5Z0_9CAUD|nr:tail tube protein [Xanthomonas phage Pagan]
MAKAGGTYPDILQGVSQKPAHRRRPGQTHEQINVLSDPVNGLVRRRGTRFAASQAVVTSAELRNMDVFDFMQEGKEYALLYRRDASTLGSESFAFLYNKTDEAFIPLVYENSTWVNTLVSGGASSLAAIGSYVYIAGNTTIPSATSTNVWQEQTNIQRLAAWVRTGKYNTTYTVNLTRTDNTVLTVTFKTVTASYPGTLDTSDIPFYLPGGTEPDPAYQKYVNDRVNEYNSAVNEWIVTSAEQTRPEYIAEQLSDLLVDAGVAATHIKGGIIIDDDQFKDITVDDEGDGTTFYAAGQEITDATYAVKFHWHGKIIRVRPSGAGADETYYLRAELENGETSGYGSVDWYEAPGVECTIDNLVSQLYIYNGVGYIARNGAGLTSLAPGSGEHPAYGARVAGDGLTSPIPWFIDKPITMLSVFQDRLVVGAQNYVNASRSADYLNFWRGSAVTIEDSDPIEIFAHGSEGDVLRHATLYNGNLVIFGDRQQYGISGDSVFSPKNPLIKAFSANKDSVDAKAQTSGNYIFYAQYGSEGTSLHQMRVGALNGQQTVTDEMSNELDSWLSGTPLQITALTAPNLVMFRTREHPQDFYLYRYEDNKNNGQRIVDSWSKFQYHPALGEIIGVSSYKKNGLVFTARGSLVACDVFDPKGEPDSHACLDSWASFGTPTGVLTASASIAVNSTSPYFLLGCPYAQASDFLSQFDDLDAGALEYGVVSEALVIPTNPFPRDQNGQAVLDGRMSLNKVTVDVENTAGMLAAVTTRNNSVTTTDFEGRILGDSDNLIARQPVYRGQLNISVGREVRECTYEIRSKDWLPLRVTGLSWTGQTFNNVRRVS